MRGNTDSGDVDDSAPSTFRPGAATSICRPTLENSARSPDGVDAATTSPFSPRSAAGYSTESARGPRFPAAATRSTPFDVAYAIAWRSAREVVVPPRLRLTILAP